MASLEEKRVNGKIFSYYFSCTLGRDSQGKQIRRYKTWKVPEGMTPSKAKKLAEREAKAWEAELRAEFEAETAPVIQVQEKEKVISIKHRPDCITRLGRCLYQIGMKMLFP